jgi:hypothetical protein
MLQGECLAPKKLIGRMMVLRLLGNRKEMGALNEPEKSDLKPLCVGSISVRGDRNEFLGSLPLDSLWSLMTRLPSATFQFIDMHGERLMWGRARIRYLSFCKDIDPDHLEYAREET